MTERIVCFDIDGVIATGGAEVYAQDPPRYDLCTPVTKTILAMDTLHAQRVTIKLFTARWEIDRRVTLEWLSLHDVPYHELHMGKPVAHLYVDDRSFPMQFRPAIHADAGRLLEMLDAITGE